jgi:hypothetical protein
MKNECKSNIKINKKESNYNDLARRRFLSKFKENEINTIRTKKPTYTDSNPTDYHGYNTPEYVSTLVKNLYVIICLCLLNSTCF